MGYALTTGSIALEWAVWEGFRDGVGWNVVSEGTCSEGTTERAKVQWENEPRNVASPTQGAESEPPPPDVCDGNSQATGLFKSNCFSFIFLLTLVQKLDQP